MKSDKVFNKNSDLVFEGTTEETLEWVSRHSVGTEYIRSGKTSELMSIEEFTGRQS